MSPQKNQHKDLAESATLGALLEEQETPSKTSFSAAILEKALQHETDQRKTERFFWILACCLLFDAIIISFAGLAVIFIFLMELVLLIGLATWLDVDFVKKPLQEIFEKYVRKTPKQ